MKRRFKFVMSVGRASLCGALLLFVTVLTEGQSLKLERGWQFLPDRSGSLKLDELKQADGWRDVRVNLSWNAQFADLREYMGVAWYRITLSTPDLRNGRHALLHFAAVDYFSEVFVNGKRAGTHEGGYTPFIFDITDALHPGANELLVRVVDPPMDERENRARFPEMLYNEIPHGKQNWYVQTGGIWQPVWLESRPALYIEQVHVTATLDGNVSVQVHLAGDSNQDPNPISVTVRDADGNVEFTAGGGGITTKGPRLFQGKVKAPKLWSPVSPTLYVAEVKLNGAQDSVTERFGFRSFEARAGKFYLNTKPFYMIAALDQDFYPDTIYTTPSENYVRDQMLKAKRLGLNLLRCHIKVCDPTYLKTADEVGMLVWYEIPSWNDFNHFSSKAAERGEKIFREMVQRDWNHPAIVIQSVINEGWGTNLPEQIESRRWLRAAFDRAKQLTAPLGRLIVDNSACCSNFHLKTDIEDNHRYNSIPDEYTAFDSWVAEFARRPKWNFSPHGDAEPTGSEPLVLSEFGNWGLPKLPKELPWWFERDFGGRQVTRPAGLFERFKQFRFDRLFNSFDSLAEVTQWHQFISLKHEIEEIRRHSSIQGYVITEFTDINWEANGLMSMWREPKVYATELARIQQPDVVFARTNKRNYIGGEPIQFEALVSHFSERDLRGALLVWHTENGKQQGRQPVEGAIAPATVTLLAKQSFPAPDVAQPQRTQILFELRDRNSKLIAENTAEVFVYPKPGRTKKIALGFYDPKGLLGLKVQQLEAAGYVIKTDPGDLHQAPLLIATTMDDKVELHLRDGGRVLLLADTVEALPSGAPIKLMPRAGSDLDGNWVTNFNWVRTDASSPFGAVAFTKILGFESEHVVPRFVIQGISGADYDDVLSGIFYGWLNNNAALAVQFRSGSGALLLTTFRFDNFGSDPYATQLLEAMIAYASGPRFAPKLEYRAAMAINSQVGKGARLCAPPLKFE